MEKLFRLSRRIFNVLSKKDFFTKPDCKIETKRFGSVYGGWVLATEFINTDAVVYSFGVGEDITFDLELLSKYGLKIYAFDPTPKSIEWVKSQVVPDNFVLYEFGLSDKNGVVTFYPPANPKHISHSVIEKEQTKDKAIKVQMKNLVTIMQELNHSHIDILKMDIEGAEYAVIEDLKTSNIRPKQLLIEFHHRFPGIGINKSKNAIKTLRDIGYQIFSISESGEEYCFIRKDLLKSSSSI